MRALRGCGVFHFLVSILLGAAFTTSASAEDLKGRWYFGGNISYLSTTDDIRNNAAIIYTNQFGDDGIPFTGDPNELQGCDRRGSGSFSADPFCDPRPDDLLSRSNTIEETFKYDLTVGYGMTSWLSLQLDASYFKGSVGPIDTFLRETYPAPGPSVDPENQTANLTRLIDKDKALVVPAGDLTEYPISLTAIVRFRKDSPLNPYIGAGVGMIFADMSVSDEVGELNGFLNRMRIRGVGNEYGKELPDSEASGLGAEGRIPNLWPVSVTVDDAFEWHLVAGGEYFLNDRWSFIFDARYTFADQSVEISLGGEDQADFIYFPGALFRPDGSVKIFAPGDAAPNPLCGEAFVNLKAGDNMASWTGVGCDPLWIPGSSRIQNPSEPGTYYYVPPPSNPDPNAPGYNPGDPLKLTAKHVAPNCVAPASGDFDHDGQMDRCYAQNISPSAGSNTTSPEGFGVVQGGKIDLTGFSVALGVRIHF